MKKIRWGLVSTANINRRVIPAIRATKRGELAAVASRSVESANAYAAKWEIPHSFGSYQDMLESGMVDAVYISLPNHLHAEWSIKAMQQGVHVLCEKPFAISLEEVDQMIAASQAYDRVLAEAFMYRHHPQTKIVGEWAHQGRLGDLLYVRGVFNFPMSSRDNVRLNPDWGGGALWDVGVYPLSFAQYIFQSTPEWVTGSQVIGDTGVDESFGGLMGYSGGKFAQIGCSFQSPFYTMAEVIGTEGRLLLNRPFTGQEDGLALLFFPREGEPRQISVPEKELYISQVEDMHAAILDQAQNYLTLTETRNHVKTTLALYQAAREGKIIKLD